VDIKKIINSLDVAENIGNLYITPPHLGFANCSESDSSNLIYYRQEILQRLKKKLVQLENSPMEFKSTDYSNSIFKDEIIDYIFEEDPYNTSTVIQELSSISKCQYSFYLDILTVFMNKFNPEDMTNETNFPEVFEELNVILYMLYKDYLNNKKGSK
jgi:hypothetical protein